MIFAVFLPAYCYLNVILVVDERMMDHVYL